MKNFKDGSNRWLTAALFLETASDKSTAMFTINDQDVVEGDKVYLSLKRVYLETLDPTEYRFATRYLGGWKHWLTLQRSSLLKPVIEDWRMELEVAIRSEQIAAIGEFAKGPKGFQAAKFLAEAGWRERKVGAPSKAEKEGALKRDAALESALSDDAERLGLRVVK